jgi:serine/threonine-protein kinase RsbW
MYEKSLTQNGYSERLVINSELKYLNLARNFITGIIKQFNVPVSYANKIVLATDEALSNIIEHAYELDNTGYIDININVTDKRFKIYIIDNGMNFALPQKPSFQDIMKTIKQGKKRGLGIFLTRRVMDEIKYSYKNRQNHLVLVKYLD